MPTVMTPQHMAHHGRVERSAPQKICITMGIAFIVVGLVGVLVPGILGLHLSMAHNSVHIASGALALWCGYSSTKRAFNFCLGFGAIYGLLGLAGFILGAPGYPSVGHMQADQYLFRIIPNVLELGTIDHIVHLLISAFLLFTAYTYRKDRVDTSNLATLNRKTTLGESDRARKL